MATEETIIAGPDNFDLKLSAKDKPLHEAHIVKFELSTTGKYKSIAQVKITEHLGERHYMWNSLLRFFGLKKSCRVRFRGMMEINGYDFSQEIEGVYDLFTQTGSFTKIESTFTRLVREREEAQRQAVA